MAHKKPIEDRPALMKLLLAMAANRGACAKQLAVVLELQEWTVVNQLRALRELLGVDCSSQIVMAAWEYGTLTTAQVRKQPNGETDATAND